MIVDTVSISSFSQAIGKLRSLKRQSFQDVVISLQQAKLTARLARIVAELRPDLYQEITKNGVTLNSLDSDDLMQQTLNAINEVAPLDDMFENELMDGSIPLLYPQCCGYPMSWDEWEEMAEDPGFVSPSMSFYVFVTAWRIGDERAFINGSEVFGWNLRFENSNVDWEKFCKLLDKNGLGIFKNAFDVAMYSTGNPFFDFNPFDENYGYEDLHELSIEGVRSLAEDWKKAKPIIEENNKACTMFAEQPELAGRLVKLMRRCRIKENPAPRPPKTLIEIFAEDGQERDERELGIAL